MVDFYMGILTTNDGATFATDARSLSVVLRQIAAKLPIDETEINSVFIYRWYGTYGVLFMASGENDATIGPLKGRDLPIAREIFRKRADDS